MNAFQKKGESLQEMLAYLTPQGNNPNQYIVPGLAGAGIGSVAGGIMSQKGKMLQGMLRGGALGAGTGLGVGAGQTFIDNLNSSGAEVQPLGRALIPATGGLAGLAGAAFANRAGDEIANRKKKDKNEKEGSAFAFGQMVKAALGPAQQ